MRRHPWCFSARNKNKSQANCQILSTLNNVSGLVDSEEDRANREEQGSKTCNAKKSINAHCVELPPCFKKIEK